MSERPTAAEIEAEVRLAASENRVPFEGRGRRRAATPPPDPAVLTGGDLTGDLLPERRWVEVGGGKGVWVGALNGRGMELLFSWVGESEWRIGPGDDDRERQAKSQAALASLQALQVVLVCYRGKTGDERCFERGDAPSLKKFLPYEAIKRICVVSEELAAGEEAVGPAARDFFTATATFCETWLSASGGWDGCPAGLREQAEALASLAQAALLRGKLESGTTYEAAA